MPGAVLAEANGGVSKVNYSGGSAKYATGNVDQYFPNTGCRSNYAQSVPDFHRKGDASDMGKMLPLGNGTQLQRPSDLPNHVTDHSSSDGLSARAPAPVSAIRHEDAQELERRFERPLGQIGVIAGLSDGWLGPGSLAPKRAVLSNAICALNAVLRKTPDVEVVPTVAGGISLEVHRARVEISVELDESGHAAYVIDDAEADTTSVERVPFDAGEIASFFERGSRG